MEIKYIYFRLSNQSDHTILNYAITDFTLDDITKVTVGTVLDT